ncbi:AraC family transcriptional regulator [Paenibacillus sp. J2TS4]|uniref:helix-turn-helix domain-containing protein n=1 Tax=Paenibacillus sp. J2TS4 TaxID=2807194 RepID=UPI001B0A9F24|nr:helix-turn-helix domain-containing protein [Paenibacillus sp. J2TS4]GIP32125.1 hypothetical protein J2TS4_13350 [Paenibacillus sp. J2TS4]
MKWAVLNRQSLVFKVFFSFLVIILLFSVFNLLSVHLFNQSVQNEIIQYNRLILKNTVERYQTHIERVKTLLFDIYMNEQVVAFNRKLHRKTEAEIDYWKAGDVVKSVRSPAYNPMFFLNNLFLYFDSRSLIVEKEGTVEAEMLFSQFYESDAYPLSYWKEQMNRNSNYVLHPEATFTVSTVNSSVDVQLIPFSFRATSSNYMLIALLDARALQEAFYGIDNRHFMIVTQDGSLLYRSSDTLSANDIPVFANGKEYGLVGNYYFFIERTADLTYVTAVPYANIASQVRNASLLLLLICIVSIVIGVFASVFFSRKINRPVKQMVTSIMRRDPVKLQSAILEFDLIHQNIYELMKEKETIQKDLTGKRSLLTSFGYINKLKAITSDINEWKDIAEMDEPFVIVLYQLHFKTRTVASSQMQTDRMAYYIQEYINVVISERMPSSHTFQIENNQILSLIRAEEIPGALDETLTMLKEILDRDQSYFLVTIAVSSIYGQAADLNDAYRQVLKLAEQARPLDETQVIREYRRVPAHPVLTVPQEQELYANLQAGNHLFCIAFMERILDQLDKKEASLQQLRELALGVIVRVAKMLEPYGEDADSSMRQTQLELMQECCTIEQFKQFLAQLLHTAGAIIQSRKQGEDPTIAFVMDYVENRFAEDLSLDLLADKLNLSVAYLSVYIKEKTGANFSEHINAVRISKAKEMLLDTDLSVKEISLRIGYRNVTSFIRMFKKITGIPPGEYRKSKMFESGVGEMP